MGRCPRVEPWVKRPHLAYRHCPSDATVSVEHDGMTFTLCAVHAAQPTCGASLRPKEG